MPLNASAKEFLGATAEAVDMMDEQRDSVL